MKSRVMFIYGVSFFLILGWMVTYLYVGFWSALFALIMTGLSVLLLILA